jgi:hypothetical protein
MKALIALLLLTGLGTTAWAQRVDVRILLFHAQQHPETGEPCGGAFAGPGLTTLNLFFDNIEFNARDLQDTWPDRAADRLPPGQGTALDFQLQWSPGNPAAGVQPGLQSSYAARIGWIDRDRIATDRSVNLPAHRIIVPQRHYITRNGWTTQDPGRDFARHGVIICNRPPSRVETSAIFQDLQPGSVFLGWRHIGGLAQAVDWSRTEVFLGPEARIVEANRVFTQAAWGSTNRTVQGLDCGRYFACYRNVDHYGHVFEACSGDVLVDRCVEPDMAVPPPVDAAVDAVVDAAVDAAVVDAVVDAAVDMAIDAAIPPPVDMAVVPRDAAVVPVDMAVVPADAALPPLDMAAPPLDAALPPLDMAAPPLDAALPPLDMAEPPLDAALPPLDMAAPPLDAALPPLDMAGDVGMSLPRDVGMSLPLDQGPDPDMAPDPAVDLGVAPVPDATVLPDAVVDARDARADPALDGLVTRPDAARGDAEPNTTGETPGDDGCGVAGGGRSQGGVLIALVALGLLRRRRR